MSAAERSIAAGFAIPFPAMSGAEPCTGSKMPGPPSPRLAEPASPSPPVSAAATSERMSPKVFSVSDHVEAAGREHELDGRVVDEHVLELDVGVVGGHALDDAARHSREVSRTFALSTEVSAAAPRARQLEAAPRDAARPGRGGTRIVSKTVPSLATPRAP